MENKAATPTIDKMNASHIVPILRKWWCQARDCDFEPEEGWTPIFQKGRRHDYCPTHAKASALAHKRYKHHEEKHAFVHFKDADLKLVITNRQEWAKLYLREEEASTRAHPAFIALVEQLLVVPQTQRRTLHAKLLKEFHDTHF